AGLSGPCTTGSDSASPLPASQASPAGEDEKASFPWMFCCMSLLRAISYLPLLSFVPSVTVPVSVYPLTPPFGLRSAALTLPTTCAPLPSADLSPAARSPLDTLSRRTDTRHISWGKLSRLPCTAAGSTLLILDGYELRGK